MPIIIAATVEIIWRGSLSVHNCFILPVFMSWEYMVSIIRITKTPNARPVVVELRMSCRLYREEDTSIIPEVIINQAA